MFTRFPCGDRTTDAVLSLGYHEDEGVIPGEHQLGLAAGEGTGRGPQALGPIVTAVPGNEG